MEELFEWIIIDSAPVLSVSDANIIAEICDGVLLVVRAGVTPSDVADKARLEFRTNRLLGVVLNRATPESSFPYHAERNRF